jgi:aryl-alcohol dehydrogenase-like predicted oxidoreductase
MDYVNLGNTGLKVSRICLGMMTYGTPKWREWVLSEEDSRPFVKQALELGINFFDTADIYSNGVSEEVTGRALRDFARRDEYVLATKVYNAMGDKPNMRGLGRKHILSAIDASLKRLGVDYVDLYQIHRWDDETPIEETMEALNDVVRAGKARYVGGSSMYSWQFLSALNIAERRGWASFVSMQNHYNLTYREEEREMLPLCRARGIGVIPWSPIARGFLARPPVRADPKQAGATVRTRTDGFQHAMYYRDNDFDVAQRLSELSEKRGLPMAQLALAWLLHKPGLTAPIVGASKPGHLEDAVAAVSVQLSPDELTFLEECYQPHPVLGF